MEFAYSSDRRKKTVLCPPISPDQIRYLFDSDVRNFFAVEEEKTIVERLRAVKN